MTLTLWTIEFWTLKSSNYSTQSYGYSIPNSLVPTKNSDRGRYVNQSTRPLTGIWRPTRNMPIIKDKDTKLLSICAICLRFSSRTTSKFHTSGTHRGWWWKWSQCSEPPLDICRLAQRCRCPKSSLCKSQKRRHYPAYQHGVSYNLSEHRRSWSHVATHLVWYRMLPPPFMMQALRSTLDMTGLAMSSTQRALNVLPLIS